MALYDEFERLRGSIMHLNPLPSVDSAVSELLDDEICLKSQVGKGILPTPNPSIFVAYFRPFAHYGNKTYAKVGFDDCSFCKQKVHWKAQYPKLNRAPHQ